MTTPVHGLAAEVLNLPAEDRARMLELLIASFEPKSNAQKAWMSLALRRRDEVRSGKVCWRRMNFEHLCRFNIDQGLLLT